MTATLDTLPLLDSRAIVERTLLLGGHTDGDPMDGYVVGGAGRTERVTLDHWRRFGHVQLDRFRRNYALGRRVSTWVDGDAVYLDVVDVVDDAFEARLLGEARGERAIYDARTGTTIPLG